MKTRGLTLVLLGVASLASAAQRLAPSHAVPAPAVPALREVARVNGVALYSDRLDSAINALVPLESFHRNVSDARMQALRRQALEQLIDDELEFQDGESRHVSVTAREIDDAFAEIVTRYGGRARFAAALAQTGATVDSARREVRRSLIIKKTHANVVLPSCQVSRADAERFYAEHPERFIEPEQLHVYAITLGVDPSGGAARWTAAREKAESLKRALDTGASFEALATQHSTDASRANGGDLGYIHRGSLTPQFEAVAKELPLGQPSDVIETIYGYHLIRVSDIRPPRQARFVDVADTLTKDLSSTRCEEVNHAWLDRLRARATITVAD